MLRERLNSVLIYGLVIAFVLYLAGSIACGAEPLRLLPPDRHAELVKLIPATDDPWFERLRRDPRLVVYDDTVMPKVSQFWDPNPIAGAYRADQNISANPKRQYDNRVSGGPGQEFPWRRPFGLETAEGWSKFTFFRLPSGQAVRWWRERLPGDGPQHASYRWEFPVGTAFGEVLLVRDEHGWEYPFEARVRRKVGYDSWRPDVYRPFRTRAEYDAAVGHAADQQARIRTERNPQPGRVVAGESVEDTLPSLPRPVVGKLLGRPFTSVRGHEWVPGGHAPSTDAVFHVVPRGYAASTTAVTTRSCARCHSTTLAHPDAFGPQGRDWYGRVSGDDQVFTWHPFEPSTLGGPNPELRQSLLRAGVLKQWSQP